MRLAFAILAVPMVFAAGSAPRLSPRALAVVAFHDNTASAGRLVNGEHTLALEIQRAMWHPYGENRPGREMFSFAEPGARPVTPGPMLRVPLGTRLRVSVRNPTDSSFVVRGLQSRRSAPDSMILAPGESREVRFEADVEGTFYYYAAFPGQDLRARRFEDANLAGVFIVDPVGGAKPPEHVVVMTMSFDERGPDGRGRLAREVAVMNGRPWPFTPRLTYDLGDSIRFRFVNVSNDIHPMHLHGAYFRVDSRGGMLADSVYAERDRRMAVTELMLPGTTMRMAWAPERPGGWLLHCHFFPHTWINPLFGPERLTNEERERQIQHGHADHDPDDHVVEGMGGLMIAIEVRTPAGWRLDAAARRQLRVVLPDDSAAGDSVRFFPPSVGEGERLTPPVTREGPGAPLFLRQGEPTAIQVVNQSPDPTSIHWHGMELESYYDGVVTIGGTPGQRTTAVRPRSTLEVRMTPPRAGTFIYHTHFLEARQLIRGLYGAMIVTPAGEAFDPSRDHLYVMGITRTAGVSLNGATALPPLTVTAGETHRLRFINITLTNGGLRMHLLAADSTPVHWTPAAKDGWELPPHQRVERTAEQSVSVGETYDFLFTPAKPGRYVLQLRPGAAPRVFAQQVIEVREAGARGRG